MTQTQIPLLWADLLAVEPRLQSFVDAAEQAARNRWRGYVEWLATHRDFRMAVEAVAYQLGVDVTEAGQAIIEHLDGVSRRMGRDRGIRAPYPRYSKKNDF